jgi:excisionase family DNA binding protein
MVIKGESVETLTVRDLTKILHLSRQTIYAKLGKQTLGIPFKRTGRQYLFLRENVERYLREVA